MLESIPYKFDDLFDRQDQGFMNYVTEHWVIIYLETINSIENIVCFAQCWCE